MGRKDFKCGPLAEVRRESGDGEATLIFRRNLAHPPEKVWRALTQPNEQIEWMPFVSDRDIGTPGPFFLRMTDHEEAGESAAEVLKAEPARLLQYTWGDDVLTWELEPRGSGTRLTLRHRTNVPEHFASFAAGWHICIDVMVRFLDGSPVGPIVGEAAMEFGWQDLHEAYSEILGAALDKATQA
ncbi:SRPBCC family protein [Pannonibacter phragmitetus]|uniref:SRPBCC family protein n=1 Tax=Pannonibacter phragmitetus TaxID=121719 RepID=UPI000F457EA6|nr:SRPBCC family protein [Pannonibacter phragmitetus]MBA4207642.1 ATPase [Polymorphum sp.]